MIETLEFQRNYLNYGSVYFQRGYLEQAEASFQLALRDDPSSAEALYGLGSVYLKQEKSREARESFERATKLQASYPDTLANAWNNLGLLATREGRTAEAIPYFQAGAQAQSRSLDRARESGQRVSPAEKLGRSPQVCWNGRWRSVPRIRRRTTAWGWSSRSSTTMTAPMNICSER